MSTRRQFLKTSAIVGAGSLLLRGRAWPFDQSPLGITKFAATLPALGPGGANNFGNYITVLSPNKTKFPGTDYYEIVAKQFTQQLHPSLPATTFWGYADAKTRDSKYLGGVIVGKRGTPVKLKITNLLPPTHILPVDSTAVDPSMSAEVGGRVDRLAVHLHGGLVQWTSDGGPFAWFTNAAAANGGFAHGSSFLNGAGPGSAIYDYPNDQSARMLWYHDHAYGNTRLNAYAGVASAYLITDDAETLLVKGGVLPDLGGAFPLGIPLVIQDKTFWDPAGSDPGYNLIVPGATPGSLWYPHVYEAPPLPTMAVPPLCDGTGRWDLGPGTPPEVSLVAEAFMDTILVNGAPYPKLPVAPRRYRFRLLNGSQARFYNLQLYVGDSSADGITLRPSKTETDPNGIPLQIPKNPAGPKIIQIGTEGGFLPEPVVLNNPPLPLGYHISATPGDPKNGNANRYNLLLAPAERADVIVDFRGFEGRTVVLYNDAPAPFPGGDIRNDYYPGGPDLTCIGGAPTPVHGQGPDTRILMKFEVSSTGSVKELTFNQTLESLREALPIAFLATQPPTPFTRDEPKQKTLNEDFDSYGRLIQKLGTTVGGIDYLATPTDTASRGETQIWKIANLTGDTHPMHFHLVNVQVLKREAWKFASSGDPVVDHHGNIEVIHNSARPADPNEQGYKETVRMNPGEVVTVIMKFDLPKGPPAPHSPRLEASYGIKGSEYVWHCHILEHEEHDMMHALVVT